MTDVLTPEQIPPMSGLMDGLKNIMSGMGGPLDRTAFTEFEAPVPLSTHQLEAMYVCDGVLEKFITRPVQDALSRGVEYPALSKDEVRALNDYLSELKYWESVNEALITMRLLRGSAIWVRTGERPAKPLILRETSRQPNRVKNLVVLDSDVLTASPYNQYLEPESWQIVDAELSLDKEIHASRLLIYPGRIVSRRRRCDRLGWGESEVEKIRDAWLSWRTAFLTPANIAQTYEQGVYKFKGLTDLMRTDWGRRLIQEKITDLEAVRSIFHAHLIDIEDDFQRIGAPISGLDAILLQAERMLVAESGLPHTVLLGDKPGNWASSGDSQQRDYYQLVAGIQESRIRPNHAKFLKIIAPDLRRRYRMAFADLSFDFNPIQEQTEKEWEEIREKQAKRDQTYISAGVISGEEVREELAKRGTYSVDSFSPAPAHDDGDEGAQVV